MEIIWTIFPLAIIAFRVGWNRFGRPWWLNRKKATSAVPSREVASSRARSR
jgi:hypothetical protein